MDTQESTFGPSFSAEEAKFFETGGESGIPTDAGDGNTSEQGSSSGQESSGEGATKPAPTGGEKRDHVPVAALQEERQRRRELDRQLREAREKLANFEGRFAVLDRVTGKQPAEQGQAEQGAPNPEEDIFGAVKAIQTRLEGQEKAAKEAQAEQERHTKFVTDYRNDANRFEQTTPDFKAAYGFLLKSRADELRAIGYEDPKDLHAALTADEFAIAQRALAAGKSPAEMLYALAKQRGYQPDAAKKAAEEAARKAAEEAAQKLDAIERGQAANKSLNNTGGSSGADDMTVERLLSMPMSDYTTWVEKNPAKAKRLMGG
ncbi:hypothetical protein ACQR1I_16555 [Bradyrhizobium sp. HKCCYLS2038]|uniref:hypothetical protein n=1 Tax=unclassified Bradyrhizobium TaxID=2631580 RepID=UPI003EB93E15